MNDKQYEEAKTRLLRCRPMERRELIALRDEAKRRSDVQIGPFLEYMFSENEGADACIIEA